MHSTSEDDHEGLRGLLFFYDGDAGERKQVIVYIHTVNSQTGYRGYTAPDY